jgi:pSer/pThr/pTyr-binding forkhead associated (FHA) protein
VADRLVLRVVGGPATGTVIDVNDEFQIGRQAPGDGKLGNDIEISRRHARITKEADGRFVIEDLGSTNGTFVNGERVTSQALNAQDVIEMGDTRVLVMEPEVSEPAEEPVASSPPPGVTTFAEIPADLAPPAPAEPPAPEGVEPPAPEPVTPAPEPPALAEPPEAAEPEPLSPPTEAMPPPFAEPPAPEPPAPAPEPAAPAPEPPAPEPAAPEPVEPAAAEPPAPLEPPPPPEPAPAAAEPVPRRPVGISMSIDPETGGVVVHIDDPEGPVRVIKRDGSWVIDYT